MMLFQAGAILISLVLGVCVSQYVYETIPELDYEIQQAFAVATENETVNISCSVKNFDFEQIPTQWELSDSNEPLTFDSNTRVAVGHPYITASGGYNETLCIYFTKAINTDRLNISCKGDISSSDSVSIIVGLAVDVTLVHTPVYDAVESQTFTVDLLSPLSPDPFPPYGITVDLVAWFYDGELIENLFEENFMTGIYNITIQSVKRDYAGKEFRLDIFDPPQSANFTLNVQYEPEAQFIGDGSAVYRSVGDNVMLSAAMNISGNPNPNTSWTIKGTNSPIEIVGRYSSEYVGQISIGNLVAEDFGVYVFTAGNGIGSQIVVEVPLLEIEPRISYASAHSTNGNLSIAWTLAHTGYVNNSALVSVDVACSLTTPLPPTTTQGSANELTYVCSSNCIDSSSLVGNGIIMGPIYAGRMYQCTIVATTSNGTSSYNLSSIIPTSGIPGPPTVEVVDRTDDSITVSVYLPYPGDDGSVYFTVVVANDTATVYRMSHSARLATDGVTNVTVTDLTAGGNYSVTVMVQNRFGSSTNTVISAETTTSTNSHAPSRHGPYSLISLIAVGITTMLCLLGPTGGV